MQRLILALALLVACDTHNEGCPEVEAEPSTEDFPLAGGSTGGVATPWLGDALTVRAVLDVQGRTCEWACGVSACVGPGGCPEDAAEGCLCADDSDEAGTTPTHAVSECFTPPSGPGAGGIEAATFTCDGFCSDAGLGACAWVLWSPGSDCPLAVEDAASGGAVRLYGDAASTESPFAEGGVLRFTCEI